MQEGMDHLHLLGEMLVHQHVQEEGLALLLGVVRLMIMNKEEGGAHHIMQGKGVLLLHLNLPQVMERILQLHLDPLKAIIHISLKESILPGSALKKSNQSFEREARM